MTEWRLQETDFPSTFEYHEHRERVPHLEQGWHSNRLYAAAKMVRKSNPATVVDLGCGDGGLLQVIKSQGFSCWGYDFQPSNSEGWKQRNVMAYALDIFNTDFEGVKWGDTAVMTEVLEHLDDPHAAVHDVARHVKYLVASSPADERPGDSICDSHLWAWDWEGYEDLLSPHFLIMEHKKVDWSQLILGKSKYV